jgi:hypothetical protein
MEIKTTWAIPVFLSKPKIKCEVLGVCQSRPKVYCKSCPIHKRKKKVKNEIQS